MALKTTNKEFVQEYNYGLWVWECPDGEILGDDEGNIMSISGLRVDPGAIMKITDAARYYGFPEGRALFWQGKRQISDEHYEEQKARQKAGLVADPFDLGAIRDEIRAEKYNHGQR